MDPTDLIVGAIDFGDAPQLSIALTAVDFAPVVQPFSAISVASPEIGAAQLIGIGAPPLTISSPGGGAASTASGHAVLVSELLEQMTAEEQERDDEEAILCILLLLAA